MSYTPVTGTPLATAAELRKRYDGIPSTDDCSAFIADAHAIIVDDLGDKGHTQARFTLIEIYLALHFAAIMYPVPSFEGAKNVQESAQYKVDMGLNFTKFGQQAILLDTSGTLKGMATGRSATGITHLGPTPIEAESFAIEHEQGTL
jgi:hypothetical protein